MDFGALPPEINSGRVYSGPGPAPLLAAAASWDGLAAELRSAAGSYGATISELRTLWRGPASTAMATAATTYIAWLDGTAAQAEQTAVQAKAAAAAYEAAFAASVPPPVIAANRALLAALIATNFLGQNTPAISATEAQYAEMWAQDAAAMYGYADAAATATQLTPFNLPPTTTNDAGRTEQSDAIISAAQSSTTSDVQSGLSKLTTELPQVSAAAATDPITQLTSELPLSLTDITNILKTFNTALNTVAGPYTPLGVGGLIKNWYQVAISIPSVGTGIQGIGPLLHPKPLLGVLAPLLHSDLLTGSSALQGVGTVSATAGRAGLVGSLSVPSTWASAVPAVRTVASELPETAIDAAPAMAGQGMFGPTALSSLAGRAVGGTATRAAAGTTFRVPGAVAVDDLATTSTVIVIPPSAK